MTAAHMLPAGAARVGVVPHSVRAVPLDYLLEVVSYLRTVGTAVHMHLSEQPAEIEECLAEYGLRPIELLDRHGILDPRFTAIHAIHINAAEIGHLANIAPASAPARRPSATSAMASDQRNSGWRQASRSVSAVTATYR